MSKNEDFTTFLDNLFDDCPSDFFPNVQSKIPKLPYASVDSITPFANIKKDLALSYL